MAIGWTIAWLAITLLRKGRDLIFASFFGTVAMAIVGGIWWCEFEDSRPFLLATPLVAPILGLVGKRTQQTLPLGIALLLGFNDSVPILNWMLSAHFMPQEEILAADAADGSYRAVVVNRSGLAYGYDLLYLRPQKANLSTILDRPHREIAEFVQELCVEKLWWEGSNILHVVTAPKTERVRSLRRWGDITIRYETSGAASPR